MQQDTDAAARLAQSVADMRDTIDATAAEAAQLTAELTTTPTLGWLTWDETRFGGTKHREPGPWFRDQRGWVVLPKWSADVDEDLTFQPGTLVPTDTLVAFIASTRELTRRTVPADGWEWEAVVTDLLASIATANRPVQ